MSEVQYVKTPYDLFKTVVADNEQYDSRQALANTRTLVSRLGVNIFEDEYAILYQSALWCVKNDMPLTREVLQQLILNSREELVNSKKINISKDKQEDERFSDIVNYTMSEYDAMSEEEYDYRNLKGEMNLFIQTWAEQQMQQLIYDLNLIQHEGLRVGNKLYKGRDGVNQYYKRKYEMIDSLVNERKDYLADDIDTLTMTGVEIKDKIYEEETTSDYVSKFGIPSMDNELMGLTKGEIVVVQGGSGVGKTRFAIGTIGYQALMMGKNVLHISLEQKPTRVYPMYQARHIVQQIGTRARMSDSHIFKGTYDPADEGIVQESFVDLAENPNYGKLKIVGRDLKSDNFEDYLNNIYDEFPFDVVIIDYFGLIGVHSPQSRFAELAGFANTLKSACKYFKGQGFLAVVPNQLSTDVEAKLLKGDDRESKLGGAGSQDLLRGSDITVTLSETQDMESNGTIKLLVDKQRTGSRVPNLDMDVDKGRCIFVEKVDEDDDLL